MKTKKKKTKKKNRAFEFLTLSQVSKLTGLGEGLIRWMRGRESITLKSGPPYYKGMDEFGHTIYLYNRNDVMTWLKRKRSFRITARDASKILQISRYEMLERFGGGYHRFEGRNGRLIINTNKNLYIWIPRVCLNYYEIPKERKVLIPAGRYV